MIDLVNFENKVLLVGESPRILMEDKGEFYLRKRKIKSEAELLYSIDTKPSMMPINKIIGPNTIY